MTQDTRKDPRAKVLTMTVRYKSATLDEFIEHHSHDVSRGGMFIKTPSPFPPGTLLKFEVKIAAEQRVMQGVGRVVWKREASEISDARPAGMGVKFIKIDDESRKVIDQLVVARGEGSSAYEAGIDSRISLPAPSAPAATSAPSSGVSAPSSLPHARSHRKATMIGLGAIPASSPRSTPSAPEPSDAFFPQSSDDDMPPPEDRTVMKQAAELLQDALREAGGSLDDVGTAKAEPKRGEPATSGARGAAAAVDSARAAPSEPGPNAAKGVAEDKPAAALKAADEKKPTTPLPAAGRPPEPKSTSTKRAEETTAVTRKLESMRPRAGAVASASDPARSRPASPFDAAADSTGGGKIVFLLLAMAAVIAIAFFVNKQRTAEAPDPEPSPVVTEPAAAPAAPVLEPPAATAEPGPSVAASQAAPSAVPPASAAPHASAPTAPAGSAAPAPAAKPLPPPEKPVAPAAKPVAPAAKPQRPKPKPPAAPIEAEPPTPPSVEAPPPPEAPVKPAPAPKPQKPAPKPAPTDGDNPY